jgi:hypothetical protein
MLFGKIKGQYEYPRINLSFMAWMTTGISILHTNARKQRQENSVIKPSDLKLVCRNSTVGIKEQRYVSENKKFIELPWPI